MESSDCVREPMVKGLLRVLGDGVHREVLFSLGWESGNSSKKIEHIEGQMDPGQVDQWSRHTRKVKSLYRGWRCGEQSLLRKSSWWVRLPEEVREQDHGQNRRMGHLKVGRGRCWKGAGEKEGASAGGVRGRGLQEGESTASALQRDEGASLEQGSRLSVEKEGRVAIRADLSWGAVTWGQNVRHEIGSEVGKSHLRGMKIGKRGWSGKAAVSTEKADALCATEGPAESRGHTLPGEAGTRWWCDIFQP